MKNISTIIAILFTFLSVHITFAEEENRIATLLDNNGLSHEVLELDISQNGSPKFQVRGLLMSTEIFQLVIPINQLISIKKEPKGYSVSYLWQGKTITTTGNLFAGKLSGKSDFGNIELDISQLQSMEFNQLPIEKPANNPRSEYERIKQKEDAIRAILTLRNGDKVNVRSLKRYFNYYTTEGYVFGGTTLYRHWSDLHLLRGEALLKVDFLKIKLIEFTDKKGVSVTLMNGKVATGQISDKKEARIYGFSGVFEKGGFFLDKDYVKKIEFLNNTE